MPTGVTGVLVIAVLAAVASPLGGAVAWWRRPTTLFMSVSLGFASGVLLATIAFEMVPKALMLGSLWIAVGSFAAGFAAIYLFDLWIHRGKLVGAKAEQRSRVLRFYEKHHPLGTEVTVLAGGTSAEEVIEGVSIGVGAAIEPRLGAMIALAILIDNFAEGLGIGEIIRSEKPGRHSGQARRIFGWTALIGAAVLVSTLVGWFLLRDMARPVLGSLFGFGAGGMFYLTVTDLVPAAEERQYQQAGAIAIAAGFLLIFVLATQT